MKQTDRALLAIPAFTWKVFKMSSVSPAPLLMDCCQLYPRPSPLTPTPQHFVFDSGFVFVFCFLPCPPNVTLSFVTWTPFKRAIRDIWYSDNTAVVQTQRIVHIHIHREREKEREFYMKCTYADLSWSSAGRPTAGLKVQLCCQHLCPTPKMWHWTSDPLSPSPSGHVFELHQRNGFKGPHPVPLHPSLLQTPAPTPLHLDLAPLWAWTGWKVCLYAGEGWGQCIEGRMSSRDGAWVNCILPP